MPTRNVVLTDRHEAFIKTLVAEGRYQNASEVLRDALRLIEAREAAYAEKLAAWRAAAQVGLDDVAAGRFKDFSCFDDLIDYLTEVTDPISRQE
jgi:antitoxin ParD1/3/4